MAAQLMATKGPWLRALLACTARATSSLPVPDSPMTSTVASVAATLRIWENTPRMTRLSPTISGNCALASSLPRASAIWSATSPNRSNSPKGRGAAATAAGSTGGVAERSRRMGRRANSTKTAATVATANPAATAGTRMPCVRKIAGKIRGSMSAHSTASVATPPRMTGTSTARLGSNRRRMPPRSQSLRTVPTGANPFTLPVAAGGIRLRAFPKCDAPRSRRVNDAAPLATCPTWAGKWPGRKSPQRRQGRR